MLIIAINPGITGLNGYFLVFLGGNRPLSGPLHGILRQVRRGQGISDEVILGDKSDDSGQRFSHFSARIKR
jgi:hypothetical protein